ncbi:MAG TPA: hypothetical protein VKP65_09575, partial [Rhodothermales bacterium]|nr:hypothetical protein [Rhodothermales bacterium]
MQHALRTFLLFLILALCVNSTQAQEASKQARLAAEESGIETEAPGKMVVFSRVAQNAPPPAAVLLIPESSNDRVMAFDPTTGDLVDADFIPADPTNLSTPIHVLPRPNGNFLISDQIDDVVQEYDMDGNYIGVFAPAGGVNTAILDNVRGMAWAPNGNLLVTVGGGANADAIAEFDASGNFVGNRIANGAGGLDSPFDVIVRSGEFLVGGITSDALHRYDLAGTYLGDLTAINTFPEQLQGIASGNILVSNFSGTEEGVVEYTAAGAQVDIYDPASLGGYRGVYELPNGNILTTNGDGVHEIDRAGNLVETKISGVSARFITFVSFISSDLGVNKTSSTANPQLGDEVIFTITVGNDGPNIATNVEVEDILPPELTFVSSTASQGAYDDGTGLWTVGTLVSGFATLTITTEVTDTSPSPITNTASVSSLDQVDPNPDNDSDTVVLTIQSADLSIDKSVSDT